MTLCTLPQEVLHVIALFIAPRAARARASVYDSVADCSLRPRDVEWLEGAWSPSGSHFLCTQRIATRPFAHGVVGGAEYANWHFDHTDLVFLDCFGAGKLFVNCDQVWLDKHRDEAATTAKFAEVARAPATPQMVGQVCLSLAKHLQIVGRGRRVQWVVQREAPFAAGRRRWRVAGL